MRTLFHFGCLLLLKGLGRLFFRFRVEWIGAARQDRWAEVRIAVLLNHTSLFEPVFAAIMPVRFLWQVSRYAVVPVAEKTLRQPVPRFLFRTLAGRILPLAPQADEMWGRVIDCFRNPRSLMLICPEGRMLRPTGWDRDGGPMTLRGGVADVLSCASSGTMLLVYSGGLHHVVSPGQTWPRLFRTIQVRLEVLDIPEYQRRMGLGQGRSRFRKRVVEDLTQRRNRHCPIGNTTIPHWAMESPAPTLAPPHSPTLARSQVSGGAGSARERSGV